MINYGFERRGGCTCGGVTNKKYYRDDLIVYLRPRNFKIKRGASTIIPLTDLNELNETLATQITGL